MTNETVYSWIKRVGGLLIVLGNAGCSMSQNLMHG